MGKQRKTISGTEALYKIGDLEDKYCKPCKRSGRLSALKENRSVSDMQNICLNECAIGKRIKALGGIIQYGSYANGHFKAPDLTKEKYIELRKKHPDAKIREMYKISRVTLSRRKRSWGLTKLREYSIPRLLLKDMTPEKLEELSKDFTDKEIGKMYGASRATVQKRRLKWGIKKGNHLLKDRFTLDEYKYLSKNKKLKDKEILELWEISESSLIVLKTEWGIIIPKKTPDFEALGLTYEKMLQLVPEHTDKEIADMYGTYETTITKYRKKLGISHLLRKPRYKLDREHIKDLLDTDKTKIEIAEELGIHVTTLNKFIRDFSL